VLVLVLVLVLAELCRALPAWAERRGDRVMERSPTRSASASTAARLHGVNL
jgi:hypothetical protein